MVFLPSISSGCLKLAHTEQDHLDLALEEIAALVYSFKTKHKHDEVSIPSRIYSFENEMTKHVLQLKEAKPAQKMEEEIESKTFEQFGTEQRKCKDGSLSCLTCLEVTPVPASVCDECLIQQEIRMLRAQSLAPIGDKDFRRTLSLDIASPPTFHIKNEKKPVVSSISILNRKCQENPIITELLTPSHIYKWKINIKRSDARKGKRAASSIPSDALPSNKRARLNYTEEYNFSKSN